MKDNNRWKRTIAVWGSIAALAATGQVGPLATMASEGGGASSAALALYQRTQQSFPDLSQQEATALWQQVPSNLETQQDFYATGAKTCQNTSDPNRQAWLVLAATDKNDGNRDHAEAFVRGLIANCPQTGLQAAQKLRTYSQTL